jgi:hypothetical protein
LFSRARCQRDDFWVSTGADSDSKISDLHTCSSFA